MKNNLKSIFLSAIVLGTFTFLSCNNSNKRSDSEVQDSLRRDSIMRSQPEDLSDSLINDSLSPNNMNLRTP